MSLTPRWNACWNCFGVYTAAISGGALPETAGSVGGGGFGGGSAASLNCDGFASARACTRSGAQSQYMARYHAPPLDTSSSVHACVWTIAPMHDARCHISAGLLCLGVYNIYYIQGPSLLHFHGSGNQNGCCHNACIPLARTNMRNVQGRSATGLVRGCSTTEARVWVKQGGHAFWKLYSSSPLGLQRITRACLCLFMRKAHA